MIEARLNPADQFTLMMDREIRKSGLAGNYCAIILDLDSIADEALIKHKCRQFSEAFPQSTVRLNEDGRRFKWLESAENTVPFYKHIETDNTNNVKQGTSALLTSILNQPTPQSGSAPVELHLIISGNTSQLVLRWFHPVCDAKGAELILYHLFEGNEISHQPVTPVINQIMDRLSLWDKIKLGFKSKKNIQQLDTYSSIVPAATTRKPDCVRTKVVRFNERDSGLVLKQAQQTVGLAGITLYFIGCMMRALEHSGNLQAGEAYCVPYAMNLRKRKSLFPVFGNQVSFLFAQAPKDLLHCRQTLFTHLRDQNKNAIKQGLDRAMLPLMLAGSWLSLEKYGNIVRYSPQGAERSSFWFSFTGSMDPETKTIGNSAITGMSQFCQLTAPPSLGLLVNNYQNRLTLSFNYVNNQFSDNWLTALAENMSNELLAQIPHQ